MPYKNREQALRSHRETAHRAYYRDIEKSRAIARSKYDSERARRMGEAARLRFLDLLGPWCRFCGETDSVVLQVDHIIPLRQTLSKRVGSVDKIYRHLRDDGSRESPFNLQVLCANCHVRKTKMDLRGNKRAARCVR